MGNVISHEEGRITETVKLGVLKAGNTAVETAPSFEGTITNASKVISAVTSFSNVAVGTEISSTAFPVDTHVTDFDSTAKTITVNNAATESLAKGAITARNYLQNSSGAAEEKILPLESNYAHVNKVAVEVNVIAVTGTPKCVFELQESIDGGSTWFKVEDSADFAEITAAAKAIQRIEFKSATSSRLRLVAKLGANGGIVGYAVVATDD